MKFWRGYVLIICVMLVVTACNKTETCTPKTVESELPGMQKFATDSSITVTQHETGLLYEILEPGVGNNPTANSRVTAKYIGRLLNGKGFDSSYVRDPNGTQFGLSGVISAWQIALPMLKPGGKMKIIAPSTLGYSCMPQYGEVNNQPLYFYIELISVQ